MNSFNNATLAFEFYYGKIFHEGINFGNTKALFNEGFYIRNPLDNIIDTPWRKFNTKYAEREWEWYESQNKNAEEISKFAPIWKNHMNKDGEVNSNYGYQVNRDGQWEYVKEKLKKKNNRQAVLTIYDGKEHGEYQYDTPCTIAIHFHKINNDLCMSVIMRSNDLWYGFCNDQYCFSKFQEKMAKELNLNIGWYYHFVTNFHIYNDKLNKDE